MIGYSILNIFFFIFHTAFTLFNVTGWAFRKTRKLHLATMLLTAFSWFVLGIWYGWGYCLCTDWHWTVRQKLGIHDRSSSYIHFLIFELTGVDLNPLLVEKATLAVFVLCLVLNITLLIRDRRKRQRR
jgi:hypothetical protein